MTVLFGHPGGNPNSHQAALAHMEAGWLEAFCVPWMPSRFALEAMESLLPDRTWARRLSRRRFAPLANAPKVQGRVGEWFRLAKRAGGRRDEGLSYEANDWLMKVMSRECRRSAVTAVHSYEDCSLLQFREAKRLGKACVYDMPIGYFPAWQEIEAALVREYSDWLPQGGLPSNAHVRYGQKIEEMALADVVLAPSSFVEGTIREFLPDKRVARAGYGVDLQFWRPAALRKRVGRLRFLYAGQASLRKGIPLLIEAWRAANLADAELELVGAWQLSDERRAVLPAGISVRPECSREELRERYALADVFVFPSNFEGFGLVLLGAMATGLPAIASDASAGPEVLDSNTGRVVPRGQVEPLVEELRWFSRNRDRLPEMSISARVAAESFTWASYRKSVQEAVASFC